MAKTKVKKETLSLDEEMLMWTSYRYCIGRKTYVNSLAPYIGQKYYNLLSDARAEHAATDIRQCIADCLRFHKPSFEYEGTVDRDDRNALVDYVMWINENVTSKNDLFNTEKIVCYKDGYGEKYDKKYDVHTRGKEWTHIFESDFEDLVIWETLASLFDRKHHKMITVKYDGKVEEIRCFETIEKAYAPVPDNPGFVRPVEWKWRKCWKSVNSFLTLGENAGSLNEEYIVEIKDAETEERN